MNVWIEAPFDSLPIEGYRKQRYWLMAEAFVRAGHRVVYWTSDFSHARKRFRGLEGLEGLELRFVKTKPYQKNVSWARVRSHRAYAKEWERVAVQIEDFKSQISDFRPQPQDQSSNSPDLLIVSAPPISTGDVAIRLAKKFGAKLVVDVQDAWPETFYRFLPRGLRWLAWLALTPMRRAARRLYRAADLVTGTCDRYRELTGRADYWRAYLGRERFDRFEGFERGKGLRLVYVGNLGKSYDLKTVMEGVEVLREKGEDVTLDIAGFKDSTVRLPTSTSPIRFHGMLGEEDLAKLLAECDVGVIPMRADSFVGVPNKLGEYAAADLRIVSSLDGETAALIEKYGCGATYSPGDVASFVAAVKKAKNCRGGRILAEQELDAERIYDEYVGKVFYPAADRLRFTCGRAWARRRA